MKRVALCDLPRAKTKPRISQRPAPEPIHQPETDLKMSDSSTKAEPASLSASNSVSAPASAPCSSPASAPVASSAASPASSAVLPMESSAPNATSEFAQFCCTPANCDDSSNAWHKLIRFLLSYSNLIRDPQPSAVASDHIQSLDADDNDADNDGEFPDEKQRHEHYRKVMTFVARDVKQYTTESQIEQLMQHSVELTICESTTATVAATASVSNRQNRLTQDLLIQTCHLVVDHCVAMQPLVTVRLCCRFMPRVLNSVLQAPQSQVANNSLDSAELVNFAQLPNHESLLLLVRMIRVLQQVPSHSNQINTNNQDATLTVDELQQLAINTISAVQTSLASSAAVLNLCSPQSMRDLQLSDVPSIQIQASLAFLLQTLPSIITPDCHSRLRHHLFVMWLAAVPDDDVNALIASGPSGSLVACTQTIVFFISSDYSQVTVDTQLATFATFFNILCTHKLVHIRLDQVSVALFPLLQRISAQKFRTVPTHLITQLIQNNPSLQQSGADHPLALYISSLLHHRNPTPQYNSHIWLVMAATLLTSQFAHDTVLLQTCCENSHIMRVAIRRLIDPLVRTSHWVLCREVLQSPALSASMFHSLLMPFIQLTLQLGTQRATMEHAASQHTATSLKQLTDELEFFGKYVEALARAVDRFRTQFTPMYLTLRNLLVQCLKVELPSEYRLCELAAPSDEMISMDVQQQQPQPESKTDENSSALQQLFLMPVQAPTVEYHFSSTGYRGLINSGNSCFMNSALQVLFMTDAYRCAILRAPITPSLISVHPLLFQLQRLFALLCCSRRACLPTQEMQKHLPPMFADSSQQDSSEFAKYLLDQVQKALKAIKQTTEHQKPDSAGFSQLRLKSTTSQLNGGRLHPAHCNSSIESHHKVELLEPSTQTSVAAEQQSTSLQSCPNNQASISETAESQQQQQHNNSIDTALTTMSDTPAPPVESKIDTSPDEWFGGYSRTICTCLTCGTQSSRREAFLDLSLALHQCTPADKSEIDHQIERARRRELTVQWQPTALTRRSGVTQQVSVLMHLNAKNELSVQFQSSHELNPAQRSVAELFSTNHKGDLQLPLMIDNFLSPELLQGSNAYACDSCHSRQTAMRETHIEEPPQHLFLCLNRNAYDAESFGKRKIRTSVQFEPLLSLPVLDQATSTPRMQLYALYGVVVHSGISASFGHYYSVARSSSQTCRAVTQHLQQQQQQSSDSGANQPADTSFACELTSAPWICFNDTHVSESSWSTISALGHGFSAADAYVLTYVAIDTQADLSLLPPVVSPLADAESVLAGRGAFTARWSLLMSQFVQQDATQQRVAEEQARALMQKTQEDQSAAEAAKAQNDRHNALADQTRAEALHYTDPDFS